MKNAPVRLPSHTDVSARATPLSSVGWRMFWAVLTVMLARSVYVALFWMRTFSRWNCKSPFTMSLSASAENLTHNDNQVIIILTVFRFLCSDIFVWNVDGFRVCVFVSRVCVCGGVIRVDSVEVSLTWVTSCQLEYMWLRRLLILIWSRVLIQCACLAYR